MTDYILTHGAHARADDGMCLMEAVAWLAGEPHSDQPVCACPVLSELGIGLNDAMGKGPEGDELRARYLADLAPRLVGTRSTGEVEIRRACVLADYAVRVFAPLALNAVGLHDHAATMRDLDPITDQPHALSEAAAHAAHAAAASNAGDAYAAANAAADAEAAHAYAVAAHAYAAAARTAAYAARAAAYAAYAYASASAADYADCAAASAAYAADCATRAAASAANPDAVWTAARDAFVAAIEVTP